MKYRIKNWAQYQHYKDRCPPWIKLHHAMLTSEVWVMGTDATRALAIACMLLASRNEDNDGSFNGDPEYIKRFAYLNSKPDFKQLIEYGFIELVQDASIPLAQCNTEQSRAETETETEKRRDRADGEKDMPSPAAKAAPKKGTRLPEDWVLPKSWGEFALTEKPSWSADDVRRVAEDFRDYWLGKSGKDATKVDWLATWRKWVRSPLNEIKSKPSKFNPNAGRDLDAEMRAFCGAGNVIEGESRNVG